MRQEGYQVFISFKNLDEQGRPTRDSELASEVYNFLNSRGVRAFFSIESLKSRGGTSFKSEIDDALDSCTVLVVVGTSAENFESRWVRYEWDSFYNDILSRKKPYGRVFSYVDDMPIHALPRTLRYSKVFRHGTGSLEELLEYIDNARSETLAESPIVRDSDDTVDLLMHGTCWISYDPSTFDPERNPSPEISDMSYDLKMIQSAGFTGIVTYSSRGTLAKIPELAKQHNLRVIMGIWNVSPTSGELETAIENSDYADAFCVGHRGLSRRYSWADLNRAVQELTERTRKPVTTTEAAYAYANDPHLSRLGSWLFPDVVMPLREDLADPDTFDVKREVRQLLDLSRSMANLAVAPRRPLVCKMALYPHAGAAGTSLANQKQFFVELYRALRQNEHRFPARVSFVFHSAFDSPWKYQRVFAPWDPFTGLLDQNGSPRPAAREIVWSFGASKLL